MTPRIELFSVSDVRNWLIHNQSFRGLDSLVIAPQRAWAIIHNPYVRDEDIIVATVFENNELAAFSACFPDIINGRRAWWYSTLYCRPESTGRGFGIIVIGSLHEAHNGEEAFDMNGAKETQEIFSFLDCKLSFVTRYVFSRKVFNQNTLKGKLAFIAESCRQLRYRKYRKLAARIARKSEYTLQYVSHIDDKLYEFIVANKNQDAFLRSKEMLNWVLSYPFIISSPLLNRVDRGNHFSSNLVEYELKCICVYQGRDLVGLYIVCITKDCFAIKYLYYQSSSEQIVFNSILDHLLHFSAKCIVTLNKSLADYLAPFHLTGVQRTEEQSFCYPESFNYSNNLSIQGGDGDTFV